MKTKFFAETSPAAHPAAQVSRSWRYAPLVVWMSLIFLASSTELSAANTSKVLRPVLLLFLPHASEKTIRIVHFLIRKAAHFTEYAVFALWAARAFLGSPRQALKNHWLLAALLLIALYSLSDEFHQSFVPTRTASIYDSLIDTAGGFAALFFLALWRASHDKQTRSALISGNR